MPWPKTIATHYHAQLGLPDKGRQIKGLVVCYVVWLRTMIYGMGLLTSIGKVVLSLPCGQDGYRAQVPQHPIDSYRYVSQHSVDLMSFTIVNVRLYLFSFAFTDIAILVAK